MDDIQSNFSDLTDEKKDTVNEMIDECTNKKADNSKYKKLTGTIFRSGLFELLGIRRLIDGFEGNYLNSINVKKVLAYRT